MQERVSSMQDRVHTRQVHGPDVAFTYHCKQEGCGKQCSSYHADLVADRFLPLWAEQAKQVKGTGLGTWRCQVHGRTKVTRRVA